MSNSPAGPVVWQEAGTRHAVASGPRTAYLHLGGRQAGNHWPVPRSCVCALTVILPLLLTELLSACGGGSGGGSQQSAQATSSGSNQAPGLRVVAQAWTGHYVRAVTIAGVTYLGDAVFTQDGAVRLYVGAPMTMKSPPPSGITHPNCTSARFASSSEPAAIGFSKGRE
jgi:hypothetical protein